jgi:hypothetical protein
MRPRHIALSQELIDEMARDPIRSARRLFEMNYVFWGKGFVDPLEAEHPRRSFYFAATVMREAVPRRIKSGDPAERLAWITEFETLIERNDVAQYCEDKNRQIWVTDRTGPPN